MEEIQLDFDELAGKCIKILDENRYISVATAHNNFVRARVVDYANLGLAVGFLTWAGTVKMAHLKDNPLIALCVNNLQMEGKAVITGHPSLAENRAFVDRLAERNPNPCKNFMQLDDTVTVMVEPTLMIVMSYAKGYLYSDHLDLANRSATRKILSPWDPKL